MIKCLSNVVSTFVLVHECRGFLREISDHSMISLIWPPRYRNIVRNCIADELVRAGAELAIFVVLQCIGIPIASANLDIAHSFCGKT